MHKWSSWIQSTSHSWSRALVTCAPPSATYTVMHQNRSLFFPHMSSFSFLICVCVCVCVYVNWSLVSDKWLLFRLKRWCKSVRALVCACVCMCVHVCACVCICVHMCACVHMCLPCLCKCIVAWMILISHVFLLQSVRSPAWQCASPFRCHFAHAWQGSFGTQVPYTHIHAHAHTWTHNTSGQDKCKGIYGPGGHGCKE